VAFALSASTLWTKDVSAAFGKSSRSTDDVNEEVEDWDNFGLTFDDWSWIWLETSVILTTVVCSGGKMSFSGQAVKTSIPSAFVFNEFSEVDKSSVVCSWKFLSSDDSVSL